MFFGLTNSLATFQMMMNDIFKELIDEGVFVVFMDDILIFTESLEEHAGLYDMSLNSFVSTIWTSSQRNVYSNNRRLNIWDLSFHKEK